MTDSASDISYADEQKYSISVIPFPITLGDKSYTSRVDFDNEQFFTLMAQHDEIPKTAQITPFQFQQIYLREARAVLWYMRRKCVMTVLLWMKFFSILRRFFPGGIYTLEYMI